MSTLPLRISKPDAVHELTPPGSFDEAQTPPTSHPPGQHPTPPQETNQFRQLPRIIEAFRGYKRGRGPPRQIAYRLAPGEYEELERQLRQDSDLAAYVDDKVSYDYYAPRRRFYFRMHGEKHEVFSCSLFHEIQCQLDAIATGSDAAAAAFAQNITASGTAHGKFFYEGTSGHEPDIQFGHRDSPCPSLMIEIADSEKGKSLRDCANSYLLGSGGLVNIVVGVDFAYGPRAGPATDIKIWTLERDPQRQVREVIEHVQPLRDDQGNAIGHGLRLKLSQFAPRSLALHDDNDHDIIISALRLCDFLSNAEHVASSRRLPIPAWPDNESEWTNEPAPHTPEDIPEEKESPDIESEEDDPERDPDWQED